MTEREETQRRWIDIENDCTLLVSVWCVQCNVHGAKKPNHFLFCFQERPRAMKHCNEF